MNPSLPFVLIAIDGGAASGKSSTSRALSERFHLLHVDTGSFYRALTAALLERGVAVEDLTSIRQTLAGLSLGTQVEGRSARILVGGKQADPALLRSPEVNASVSRFAALPEVRNTLLLYQRSQAEVAKNHGFRGLVMEGRDIGSVIFPKADFRFFLHADLEERSRRRAREGQSDAIAERDRLDSQRKTAPLACPEGATAIDSTYLSLEEVVDLLSKTLLSRLTAPHE